uniref:NADH dehydrogenase subunit 4L n=1 Tax=Xenostrobus securis TaxID=1289581 RepID=UPI00226C9348|nr:NADH dehydrogenase subunit 4L [Xenostrobus securis]UZG65999.1 NADH dehydrogenase subunit 4L [Xenostrobus securis]
MLLYGLIVCCFGLFVMCLKSAHLLNVFLGMETIVLGLFIIVVFFFACNKLFLLLFIMSIGVMEAAVMLSLLVMMVRAYGNDKSSLMLADKG